MPKTKTCLKSQLIKARSVYVVFICIISQSLFWFWRKPSPLIVCLHNFFIVEEGEDFCRLFENTFVHTFVVLFSVLCAPPRPIQYVQYNINIKKSGNCVPHRENLNFTWVSVENISWACMKHKVRQSCLNSCMESFLLWVKKKWGLPLSPLPFAPHGPFPAGVGFRIFFAKFCWFVKFVFWRGAAGPGDSHRGNILQGAIGDMRQHIVGACDSTPQRWSWVTRRHLYADIVLAYAKIFATTCLRHRNCLAIAVLGA